MFLILLAALSGVNPELYEAASLDGAGWWQALRDVSLPGIARVIAVVILFRALDAFKIFDLVYMFTQGGPGTSTETISWYIYQLGFKFFRLGYASAVSYIVVILLTIIATLYVARFLRSADA
jgi:multiple sugar transport system permease protein